MLPTAGLGLLGRGSSQQQVDSREQQQELHHGVQEVSGIRLQLPAAPFIAASVSPCLTIWLQSHLVAHPLKHHQ